MAVNEHENMNFESDDATMSDVMSVTSSHMHQSTTTMAYDDHRMEDSLWKRAWRSFYPPRGTWAKWTSWAFLLVIIFGTMWSMVPSLFVTGSSITGLTVTFLLCLASEALIVKIPMPQGFPPLPQLLASLLMGFMLRNLPEPYNPAANIKPEWSIIIRTVALAVILTRAGLELDSEAMKKVKWAVVRLALIPCICETTTIAIVSHYLMGFPFIWSFMMGFMLSAVSPAVVIPCLIILAEEGYGIIKGVPSLVMAGSGVDDVLAIAGFTILLGIAMPHALEESIIGSGSYNPTPAPSNSTGSYGNESYTGATTDAYVYNDDVKIGLEMLGACVEVVIGCIGAVIFGYLITYLPPAKMEYKNFCRGAYLLCIGIFAIFATEHWGIPGAGALWALGMSFIAALRWGEDECEPLAIGWHYMWIVFQPLLFGLTGATMDIEMLDGETVWQGLIVLTCGLIIRMMAASGSVYGLNFNKREKAFVAIAWTPKGTVQAALGSAALDTALALDRSEEEIRWGEQILVLAILVTLITAPGGAFGIGYSGPRLLKKNKVDDHGMENKGYIPDEELHSEKVHMGFENEVMKRNEVYVHSESTVM